MGLRPQGNRLWANRSDGYGSRPGRVRLSFTAITGGGWGDKTFSWPCAAARHRGRWGSSGASRLAAVTLISWLSGYACANCCPPGLSSLAAALCSGVRPQTPGRCQTMERGPLSRNPRGPRSCVKAVRPQIDWAGWAVIQREGFVLCFPRRVGYSHQFATNRPGHRTPSASRLLAGTLAARAGTGWRWAPARDRHRRIPETAALSAPCLFLCFALIASQALA